MPETLPSVVSSISSIQITHLSEQIQNSDYVLDQYPENQYVNTYTSIIIEGFSAETGYIGNTKTDYDINAIKNEQSTVWENLVNKLNTGDGIMVYFADGFVQYSFNGTDFDSRSEHLSLSAFGIYPSGELTPKLIADGKLYALYKNVQQEDTSIEQVKNNYCRKCDDVVSQKEMNEKIVQKRIQRQVDNHQVCTP